MHNIIKKPLGDLCTIEKGKTGIKKAVPGGYPLVTTAEERGSQNEYHFDKPSVIIPVVSSSGHGHASLKRIHYQEGKFAVGNILCVVTPKDENILNANFLYHYLDLNKEELLVSLMRGMANVTLPIKELAKLEVPLIPIKSQIKWVELLERTSANTGKLSSELSSQQNLLSKLRQSILQDAIQGKLTEQWRKDNPKVEPASELLKKIKAEKEKLFKEGKIKKQKPLPPISPDEIPFEIPDTWQWCRLENVAQHNLGKMLDSVKNKGSFQPYLRNINVRWNGFNFNDLLYMRFEDHEIGKYEVIDGDVLICEGGEPGRAAIWHDEMPNMKIQKAIHRVRFYSGIRNDYFVLHIKWAAENTFLENYFTGAGIKHLTGKSLSRFIIPAPPLSEQKAIVSKVEKLFVYCDELYKQISKSQRESDQLMQSVLKEAFGE